MCVRVRACVRPVHSMGAPVDVCKGTSGCVRGGAHLTPDLVGLERTRETLVLVDRLEAAPFSTASALPDL